MEKSCLDPVLAAIDENLRRIRLDIEETAVKSGRDPREIKLMAVTKTVDARLINHAISRGIDLIGENRVQEFMQKKDSLRLDGARVHLIGHLQSNKVGKIVGSVDMIESVDSVSIAREIGRVSAARGLVTDILLEVNIAGEESKFGIAPSAVEETAAQIAEIEGVKVRGLMTVPPFSENLQKTRIFFANIRKLFIDIRGKNMDNIDMSILSMGMSADYREAIAEGSGLIRVGSAVFGVRGCR